MGTAHHSSRWAKNTAQGRNPASHKRQRFEGQLLKPTVKTCQDPLVGCPERTLVVWLPPFSTRPGQSNNMFQFGTRLSCMEMKMYNVKPRSTRSTWSLIHRFDQHMQSGGLRNPAPAMDNMQNELMKGTVISHTFTKRQRNRDLP